MQVAAVIVLYIACTWIDPADPGVHGLQEKYNPKKEETESSTDGQPSPEGEKKSIQTILEAPEDGQEPPEVTEESALGKLVEKACCKKKKEEKGPDEPDLYCSICDADVRPPSLLCHFPTLTMDYSCLGFELL